MPLRNTTERWGWLHQTFHWFIAVAVVAQLTVGFIFAELPPNDPRGATLFAVHGTLGATIFVVMLARLASRLSSPVPALPDTLSAVEKNLAHANHWLLYVLLLAMPIGGYLMVNAYGSEVQVFAWKLPMVIGKNEALAKTITYGHMLGAFVIIALVIVHLAAALRHELILNDNTLRRMTPFPQRTNPRDDAAR